MPGLDIISLCAFELLLFSQLLFRPNVGNEDNGRFSAESLDSIYRSVWGTLRVLSGRRQRVNSNLNPEHPRASTTDDVECFF